MPPGYAFFGALMLAIGAPRSHLAHHVFGYRYIAFSLLALWCFARRLDGGSRRWLLAAGLASGVGFCFRLDALAAAAAIGVGTLVEREEPEGRGPRRAGLRGGRRARRRSRWHSP